MKDLFGEDGPSDFSLAMKRVRYLETENGKLRGALEKIADPRKRDHSEPDAYTQLGCVMNIAEEALK